MIEKKAGNSIMSQNRNANRPNQIHIATAGQTTLDSQVLTKGTKTATPRLIPGHETATAEAKRRKQSSTL